MTKEIRGRARKSKLVYNQQWELIVCPMRDRFSQLFSFLGETSMFEQWTSFGHHLMPVIETMIKNGKGWPILELHTLS